MKNNALKPVFHPLTITVALAVMFFFGSAIGPITARDLSAGSTGGGTEENATLTPSSCDATMRLYAFERLQKYRNDIDTHFQNKSSTSSLLPDATSIFDEFVTDINSKMNSYFPDSGERHSVEAAEIQDCMKIVSESVEQAKSFFRTKATGTSTVKQTTALLDKYKTINQQLGVLNKTMLKFKSYMETFSNKVPCYIDKNCNAG